MRMNTTMPNTFCWRWESSFRYRYLPSDVDSVLDELLFAELCVHFQDDYLDCYGDPAVTGKIGTDIQDNKCSWLVVTALEVMAPEQRAELEVRTGSRLFMPDRGAKSTDAL